MRTVLVTGATSGIGWSTARLLARRGFQVIATGRRIDALHQLEEIARRENLPLRVTECDVTDDASVDRAVDFARHEFGGIDVLVNNAGYGLIGPLEVVSLEQARRELEVNIFGPMRLVQRLIPDMRRVGRGRIINVSSIAGRIVIPYSGWYSASKAALEALSDALRLELEPFGIYTVSILPGPVRTAFMARVEIPALPPALAEPYEVFLRRLRERQTGRRPFEVSPERVARIVYRAATAKHPRPRYIVTLPARMGAIGKRLLTDRMMDRITRLYYGLSPARRREP